MNSTSESGIVVDAGPASLDSEYDEYLDIPELDGSTFVNFSDAGEYCLPSLVYCLHVKFFFLVQLSYIYLSLKHEINNIY